ncbi:MAG: proline--tRNA ligase [Candidatus Dojkabacteria bacterium]
MKYSKSTFKTVKSSKEYDSRNATYLIKAGYVEQVMAGVYSYLPLGLRVLNKIENIVREEMDKIGQELLLPSLSPKANWEITGRYNTVDVLFKTMAANERSKKEAEGEYVLNPTHEDIITPTVQKYVFSYKDFPVSVYQIQTKFRNEARPKSGIMRTREFRMKDLYSFHTSKEDFDNFYNNDAKEAYIKVYQRLGIGDTTYATLASGGDFTNDYSMEFQTICEAGEDYTFRVASKGLNYNKEVAPSRAPEVKQESEQKPMEEIETKGVTGMDKLEEFLGVPASHSMKTIIYQADERVVAVGLRGDYEVNEIKLKKLLDCEKLELASEATIKNVTGAEIGYAGIVGLPAEVEVYIDDAMEHAVNFECGANKTNYHNLNVNWDRDVAKPKKFYDLKIAKEGDLNPETGEVYEVIKTSEVGNIFPLGTKYTKAFKFTFIDESGKQAPVLMGSYGIGTSRLMGVIAEKLSDEKGLVWPINIAPFHVHLITLGNDENATEVAQKLYDDLWAQNIEVMWDDRDSSAGEKFADADLIGIPFRVVVSKRSLENGGVEFKNRNESESSVLTIDELQTQLKSLLKN